MHNLHASELTVMLLALGLLIGMARLMGELARSLHQPAVLGELLAGVLLGPTVFGSVAPEWQSFLFPAAGPNAIVLQAISNLAIVLFLLVAGLEVDLSVVWEQGPAALKVGVVGTAVPFALGLAGAWVIPDLLGRPEGGDPLIFALFLATAMAISALPVIAKTLMDLNLYRTDLGMVVVSAAIFNDLIGFTLFAIILGMIGAGGAGLSVVATIGLTLVFVGLMLTIGQWFVHWSLPVLQAYTHWPAGVLGFIVTLGLFGAAFTEFIGIHAIFGAFIVGIAVGASSHLHERTRMMLEEVVSFIFAPVFFASIGLRVNFATHFDLTLVLLLLGLACAGKLIGAVAGARWGGMSQREAWAVGYAMNARGAMEIILGVLALEAGVIRQRLFVALVILAIITSAMSGPLMQWVLRQRQPHRLINMLSPKLFLPDLKATSRREVIRELLTLADQQVGLADYDQVERLAWQREELAATGIGNGVAIPHARIPGLREAVVVAGISEAGINFDAPDGQPAHVLFLLLTPREDPAGQLNLSASIARTFRDPESLTKVLRTNNYTELLATLKILETR
jgi:Kef-type K+ transport system membrane component KefB/mannitol/fructose-specific phosphotransferase system IIA component (Ntr-type)